MIPRRYVIGCAVLLLAACGRSAADNAADQLENAAEQSDPAAASVLDNAAESIRDREPVSAGAEAQNALQAAGNAQAQTPTGNQQARPRQHP